MRDLKLTLTHDVTAPHGFVQAFIPDDAKSSTADGKYLGRGCNFQG